MVFAPVRRFETNCLPMLQQGCSTFLSGARDKGNGAVDITWRPDKRATGSNCLASGPHDLARRGRGTREGRAPKYDVSDVPGTAKNGGRLCVVVS